MRLRRDGEPGVRGAQHPLHRRQDRAPMRSAQHGDRGPCQQLRRNLLELRQRRLPWHQEAHPLAAQHHARQDVREQHLSVGFGLPLGKRHRNPEHQRQVRFLSEQRARHFALPERRNGERNIRVADEESLQQRLPLWNAEGIERGSEDQPPLRPAVVLRGERTEPAAFGQQFAGRLQQRRALSRKPHLAGAPLEQRQVEALLQLPDLGRERRLRHVQPLGRTTEIELLRQHREGPQQP